MKKAILMLSMTAMLFLSGLSLGFSQDLPAAKKDSVNADKAAKPVFYDAAASEEKPKSGSNTAYFVIAAAVVVVGAAYKLTKKKK